MNSFTGIDQLALAALLSWVIQQLKNASWFPFLTQETGTWIHAVVALLATIGITVTTAHAGAGHWTIDISGLSAVGVLQFLFQYFENYLFMRASHHGLNLVEALLKKS